jgi:MFS transporter, FHS family, glucose/mannose:H+ symporter
VAQAASRFEIGLLYLAGVLQGLASVTFPAASKIFASPTGFDLSSTQYGAMFIPRVVLAILASAFGSRPAGRFGLGGQGRSCCFASPPQRWAFVSAPL